MRRRAAVVGAVVAVLTQVSVGAVASNSGHDHSGHDHRTRTAPTPIELPAQDARRGVVTTGLRVAESGPCVGLLEIVGEDAPATGRCTHGPDAAPADGRDVRTEDVSDEEAAEIVAAAPAFTCDGNGTSGRRAHAIYAHTPDQTDRYGEKKALFKAIIAGVQDQYRQSSIAHGAADPLLYRFTHTTPSGGSCQPIVDNVNLPNNSDDDTFGKTVAALQAKGYTDSSRRYLVFVDTNVLCGIGHLYGDDRASASSNWNNALGSPLFSRVDRGCWDYAETHELSHNIGAVQDSAPNSSGGGHCNDDRDLMCYADGGSTSAMYTRCSNSVWEKRLDCGGDDYFHPDPSAGSYLDEHWNTADSGWLFRQSLADGGGSGGGSSGGTNRPTISFSRPSNGADVDGPFTISGSVNDVDGDLDKVVVYVDGSRLRTLRPGGSTWGTSISPRVGTRTVKVKAVDDGGRARSVQKTFTVGENLFRDDDGSIFEDDIERLARRGVTRGCNPPTNDRFCPGDAVTRGQMAAFLSRAMKYPPGRSSFRDTASSPFTADIAKLASAGVTRGCNPPRNDLYCPNDVVTRGQMAAFMARAMKLPAASASFRDTRTSPFRSDIARLAAAGITRGCNPPANDRFCPGQPVTRAQMAAFMMRGLDG